MLHILKGSDTIKDIIVIVGPTGVGKTKLSIELAKKLNGEIINADSVSIYKDLNIGSAKPTKEEQEEAIHHLINIKEVEDEYSVYNYQKDARKTIDDINKKKKRVIMVGGTGLYIKAALFNYQFFKEENCNEYKELTNEQIKNKILEISPNIDIHINNRRRLVRALNKLKNNEEITNYKNEVLYPIKIIGLTTDRKILYERINKRVDLMFKNGLLDEINSLKNRYNDSKVLNSAIGYKEFKDYFSKAKTIDEVKNIIKTNSRHYAKRQYTFFNNQMNVEWFNVDFNNFNKTIDEVIKYINN